jgi:hypothetical protein
VVKPASARTFSNAARVGQKERALSSEAHSERSRTWDGAAWVFDKGDASVRSPAERTRLMAAERDVRVDDGKPAANLAQPTDELEDIGRVEVVHDPDAENDFELPVLGSRQIANVI